MKFIRLIYHIANVPTQLNYLLLIIYTTVNSSWQYFSDRFTDFYQIFIIYNGFCLQSYVCGLDSRGVSADTSCESWRKQSTTHQYTTAILVTVIFTVCTVNRFIYSNLILFYRYTFIMQQLFSTVINFWSLRISVIHFLHIRAILDKI